MEHHWTTTIYEHRRVKMVVILVSMYEMTSIASGRPAGSEDQHFWIKFQ
jgi:membrane-associated PAP2 superfamily phosphatase